MNNTTITQKIFAQVNWYYSARFWLSFGLIGIVTNTFELLIIRRRKKYKSIFGMTLVSLCIADILSSICFFAVGLTRVIEYDGEALLTIVPGTKRAVVWQVGHGALFFTMGTSFVHVSIIALQRFFAVFMPLRYNSSFRKKHCLILLLTVWILFFAGGVLGYFYLLHIWYATYVLTLAVCIALVLCYTAIVTKNYYAEQKRRRLMIARVPEGSKHGRTVSSKVLRLSLAVTVAFLLCTLPHSIFYLFVNANWVYYHTVNSMISVNPLLDSVVYFLFYYPSDKKKSGIGHKSQPKQQATIGTSDLSPGPTPHKDHFTFNKNTKNSPSNPSQITLETFWVKHGNTMLLTKTSLHSACWRVSRKGT